MVAAEVRGQPSAGALISGGFLHQSGVGIVYNEWWPSGGVESLRVYSYDAAEKSQQKSIVLHILSGREDRLTAHTDSNEIETDCRPIL